MRFSLILVASVIFCFSSLAFSVNDESAYSLDQTSDGGYILVGYTDYAGHGGKDVYLIKTDADGNKEWDSVFGGVNDDEGKSVAQTSDGGYIIAGYTKSYGSGLSDVWLIKTNSSGFESWNQTFGGISPDYGESVSQTSDGGYIIAGTSEGPSYFEVWLIKTYSDGSFDWEQYFGGGTSNPDYGYDVKQTADGGYIIVGETNTYGSNPPNVYLIKTNSSGNETWSKTFDNGYSDTGYSVAQTDDDGDGNADDGYIITGFTDLGNNGQAWLIKTDNLGNYSWDSDFGSVFTDIGYSVKQTNDDDDGIADDGYIIAGVYEYDNIGKAWLIKTDSSGNVATGWPKTYGNADLDDAAYDVIQNVTGSFKEAKGFNFCGEIIQCVGKSKVTCDYESWLVKTEFDGDEEWSETYGFHGVYISKKSIIAFAILIFILSSILFLKARKTN